MGVTGYVGLMGSGKTRRVVRAGLDAHALGREVFANFRFGDRVDGYMVPLCRHWGCGNFDDEGAHLALNTVGAPPDRYSFMPVRNVLTSAPADLVALGTRFGWRRGRGFVPWPTANVLTSWEQLEALRTHRDEMGAAHKVRIVDLGPDEKGKPQYTTERACKVFDCAGCSKGITVLIDELNLWAPSRLWAELGIGVLQRWAYARKDGLDIVWSAQHEARVDKVAREVTDHIWSCTAMGGTFPGLPLRLQIFHRVRWIPALLNDSNRTNALEGAKGGGMVDHMVNSENEVIVKFGRSLSTREEDTYDTYEHVASSGHLGARENGPKAARAGARTLGPGAPSTRPLPPRGATGDRVRVVEVTEGRSAAEDRR